MNQFTLPLRNLFSRPARTSLTVTGVALAICGFIALNGLVRGLQLSFEKGLEEPGVDLIMSQRLSFNLFDSSVPQSLSDKIAAIKDVGAYSSALLAITTADDQANIIVAGWPTNSFLWKSLNLIQGRTPQSDEQWSVVLGENMAQFLNKKVGDAIQLQFKEYHVVGIASFKAVINQNVAIVPLAGLQQILNRPQIVTMFEIQIARPVTPVRMAAVKNDLKRIANDLSVTDTAELAHDMRYIRIMQVTTSAISIVILIMAILTIANTLFMSVAERTYEIGVLMALGWKARQILSIILQEGLVISAVGGVLGVAIGVVIVGLISKSPEMVGLLVPELSVSLTLESLAIAAMIGPLGALYPAWRATQLSPADALRSAN